MNYFSLKALQLIKMRIRNIIHFVTTTAERHTKTYFKKTKNIKLLNRIKKHM